MAACELCIINYSMKTHESYKIRKSVIAEERDNKMNRTEMMDANGVWDRIVGTYSIGQNVIRPVGKVVPSMAALVSISAEFTEDNSK